MGKIDFAMQQEDSPEFKSILVPAGMASTPALIAAKHCSSGTGLGVQLPVVK